MNSPRLISCPAGLRPAFRPLIVVALALTTAVAPLQAQLKDPVRTHQGLLAGRPGKDPAVMVFKGVPFAAPPVGDLRWKAPQPPASWTGVRQADQFGPSPIQTIVEGKIPWTHEFMAHGAISEDCLYLNVWTPAKSPGDKLPVFVWVYGGGYNEGSSMIDVYNGEGLAKKGLVFVNLNYRVGPFGFFAHPELTRESGVNASGNQGVLDVLAALKWVQTNIAAFGGDPGNVTLAGQSAGSGIVHALVTSPLGKGLIHRAILQSGPALGTAAATSTLAAHEASWVAYGETQGAKNLAELRALPWQRINPAAATSVGETVPAAPAPAQTGAAAPAAGGRGGRGGRGGLVIDHYVINAPANDIYAAGQQLDIPMLAGANAQDLGNLGNQSANLQWARNRSATGKAPSYLYYFTRALPGPRSATEGAFHTGEVPYMLNSLGMIPDRPITDQDRKIADMAAQYWANFARTGNPNGAGLPKWESFAENPDKVLEIGDNMGMVVPPAPAPRAGAAPAAPVPGPASAK
jgi:para-nitrobenzyl esterase